MDNIKEIYLLRHGETDYNRQGIIQGSGVNLALNRTGIRQANQFYEAYKHVGFQLIISSTLDRSIQTVAQFQNEGTSTIRMAEINEINWGIYEGQKMNSDMKKAYRGMIDQWAVGNFDARLQGGESARDLATRVGEFLSMIENRHERTFLVCAHGRTMRCILCLMNREHLKEMESYSHSNTGLYRIFYDGKNYHIVERNNVSHLNE